MMVKMNEYGYRNIEPFDLAEIMIDYPKFGLELTNEEIDELCFAYSIGWIEKYQFKQLAEEMIKKR